MDEKPRKLYLIPFDDLDAGMLSLRDLAVAAGAVFGLEGFVAPAQPVPAAAFDRRRGQYAATGLMAAAVRSRASLPSPHTAVLLGITGQDLFATRLNFVFGMADARSAVAVISICRLHPEFYGEGQDPGLFRQRALKEAIHELGHIFGLPHCASSECIMHFSTSIGDTDRKGPDFCGLCAGRIKS